VVAEELDKIKDAVGEETFEKGRWQEARDVFESVALADDYVEFLTLPAYELID
jgi:malate synthase